MCFDGAADGIFEFLRGTLPFYTIAVIPLLIVISPMTPVLGANEFAVYRMQQFDLQGVPHGSRVALVNMEAKTIYSPPFTRRCVVTRLSEFTHEHFANIVQQNAGALLIILPSNFSSLSEKEQMRVMELEKSLLEEDVPIPVYFTIQSPQLLDIYYSMERSSPQQNQKRLSAAQELFNSISSSGYQLVVSGPPAKALKDIQIISIQGKLSGFGVEEQLPTIAIVAHYDAYGIIPSLSFGADSNASGVAALLELIRLMSRLYTSSRTHPRFNLLFFLSGGGKFNFQGTKKWIEDNVDSSDGSLLPDALFTMCLDTIGSKDSLYLHVSKPPKEGKPGDIFYKELQRVAKTVDPKVEISLVHKKINLAEEKLAWEHERFSIRRLPAFTISQLQSAKVLDKNTILDTKDKVNIDKLSRNVKIIAEALARIMYNISGEKMNPEIFVNALGVQKDYLNAWIEYLTRQPRSMQHLLLDSGKHPVVIALEQAMSHFLKDVKTSIFRPDKREPEVVFFEPISTQMNAYRVKPAVFDLFLAIIIGVYLSLIYLLITNFFKVERFIKQRTRPEKPKQG